MTVIRSDKTESHWTGVLLSRKASQFPRFCARHSRCGLRYQISQNIAQNHNNPSFLSYSHKFLGFLRGFVNFSFFLIPFLKVFFVFFFERLLYFSAKEKETYQMVKHFAEDLENSALNVLYDWSKKISCHHLNQSVVKVARIVPFINRLSLASGNFYVFSYEFSLASLFWFLNCDLLGFALKRHNKSIFCFYKA